jgi:O-methyltransferase involved in polyketide biosynthesis
LSIKLAGIQETLLIPLWARAVENERPNPIVWDSMAGKIMAQIDYDFSKFKTSRLSQLGVSIRTMLLDREVNRFLERNPSAVIVNLGAGLDTRRARLKIRDNDWYDLDLPDVIDVRRNFFTEDESYHFISKSMFDYSWMDDINYSGRKLLIVAEGLFMYFEEAILKELMNNISNRFTGAEMLVEIMGPALVGKSRRHDSLSKIKNAPEFKWGIKDSKELESWNPNIRLVDEWCYFDYHKKRAGLIGYIVRLPFIRSKIAPRIVQLRFED